MKSFDWKVYLGLLLSLTLLFFAVSFAQLPYLFENGEYAQYTVSIMRDQDLNIINQVTDPELNWIVSQTGNHAAQRLYGTSSYLLPFFMYKHAVEGPATDVNDYRYAQALSTVFYVFLGMIIFWKVLSLARVKNLVVSFLILTCSTSFIWYFFFISSSTNIFSLAFSLLAFAYFYLTIQGPIRRRHFFVFGLLLGLALLIRIQLYWIGLVPLIFLVKERKDFFAKSGLFILGLLLLQMLSLANSYIRNGQAEDLPFRLFWDSFSFELFFNAVKYSIWGPNGYLTISPVFLGIFGAVIGIALLWKRNAYQDLVKVTLPLLLAPVGILFAQSLIGQLQDCLAGRHLLTYFFLFFILLAVFLSEVQRISRKIYALILGLFFGAVIWNLIATASFYYRDTVEFWRWNTSYQVSLENAWSGFVVFVSRFDTGWTNAQHAVVIYFPLLLVLAGILYKVLRLDQWGLKTTCGIFFGYGMFAMLVITGCNVINNPKNVSDYSQRNLYQDKVVTKSTEALIYDDFIEMNRMSMRYYAHIGRCDLVQKHSEVVHHFVKSISSGILKDPIGFKKMLAQGNLRNSGLEDQETLEAFENEMKNNCPMLERNTL
ncbi:MAG: hypothetical protein ACKOX6_15005 [Bdellovibrio sp.]